MGEQGTFASLAWSSKGKVSRRERFVAEMDAVIRWPRLIALIEPDYPKAGQGRQPLGVEKMLRIYFLQQWFNLSDPQAEDALYASESLRRFARVALGDDVVPDESSMLRFRHLLEQHALSGASFDELTARLAERRRLLRSGTIVDATIIAAPSSTRNAAATRDPEADWHRPQLVFRHEAAHRSGPAGPRAHRARDQRGVR
jgi:IS5 family transposase